MRYVSTRGQAPELDFEGVMLAGLARDGGLYVPAAWPRFTPREMADLAGLPYEEAAFRVMLTYIGDAFAPDDFSAMLERAYAPFGLAARAPLVQIGDN
ncbi:MAG: threonine synthase, partial [Pseudomonadota bacterium]